MKRLTVYIICGCLASGHWISSYFGTSSNGMAIVNNPIASLFVGAAWPIYASYVLFEELK